MAGKMITQEQGLDVAAAEAAQGDLVGILEAIREEDGCGVARRAAEALRTAAVEGRVYGQEYGHPGNVPLCGCALGHLATVTGWSEDDERPAVPGWDVRYWRCVACDFSPLERWVLDIMPGETARTSPRLAALVGWIDSYLAK